MAVDIVITGIIILAHGSRGERGKVEVVTILEKIVSYIKPLLSQEVEIIGAALQFNKPGLEEAVDLLSEKGIKRIVIAPYFLFPGRHITEDIPGHINDLQTKYADIEFILADNLGLDEAFISLLAKKIRQAVPDLVPHNKPYQTNVIEQESMKIVETMVRFPSSLSADEITVAKRIIHASGDSEILSSIKFSQSALAAGLEAIANGSPIFTDVRMVMAGISSQLTEIFGCSISCVLDEIDTTEQKNKTRTAAAMSHLGTRFDDAIVVIGNAPTALLALLDLIYTHKSRPALIIGMPVGFVKAKESKQELMKRNVPYITIEGTRGGSAMAAATVNALLRIAADKYR